jgi:arylsulfatase A-like enzyme
VHYGHAPSDYSTDVMARWAVNFIHAAPKDRPLFLYVAPKAPHGRAIPAPRDRNTLRNYRIHHNPDYNEANTSDKPKYVRSIPPLTTAKQHTYDQGFLAADKALGAVDDAVGKIDQALRETGRLGNTMIVFLSDNGNTWGEHRWGAKSASRPV